MQLSKYMQLGAPMQSRIKNAPSRAHLDKICPKTSYVTSKKKQATTSLHRGFLKGQENFFFFISLRKPSHLPPLQNCRRGGGLPPM